MIPLSFADVTIILGGMHNTAIDRLSALQSRIKDFQRRGFPEGLNTGKGRAAEYGLEHILLLAVAFEMLELGMAPEKICILLRGSRLAVLSSVKDCVDGTNSSVRKWGNTFIYFDPRGLSDLRNGDDFDAGNPGVHIGTIADLSRRLGSKHSPSRLAVIDLASMIQQIVSGITLGAERREPDVIAALVSWSFER